MKMVWVFKTSVKNKAQIKRLSPLLNKCVAGEGKWNFDLDDIDKILRIEGYKLMTENLIEDFKNEGFICQELME